MQVKGLALIAALGLAVPALAQEPPVTPPAEPAPAPADTVQSVMADFQQAEQEWRTAYAAARKAGKRGPAIPRPRGKDYADRMFAAVGSAPDKATALKGMGWMVGRVRDEQTRVKIFAKLQSDFLQEAGMADVVGSLQREGSTAGTALIRAVLEKSPHRDAQGRACFALGQSLKSQARTAGYMQENTKYHDHYRKAYGAAEFEARLKRDPKKLEAEALALLKRVQKDFADLTYGKGTLGEKVGNILFELEHLAIGKKAPEITGTDQNGETMKLSDYAGKVVVIDFWGDW